MEQGIETLYQLEKPEEKKDEEDLEKGRPLEGSEKTEEHAACRVTEASGRRSEIRYLKSSTARLRRKTTLETTKHTGPRSHSPAALRAE